MSNSFSTIPINLGDEHGGNRKEMLPKIGRMYQQQINRMEMQASLN